jgi:AraC family transcriptional regulator, transcriptional activator of pobA
MKRYLKPPYIINSISELHRLWSLPKPEHPLVSFINLGDIKSISETDKSISQIVLNFYSVWLEKGVEGKIKYGQNYFDFDEGMVIFISPGQVISTLDHHRITSGLGLVIHPDFLKNYPLAKTIKDYGFFSYSVFEALHLSGKEEEMIVSIMQNISCEYHNGIDNFSQDVMLSQIEVLLNYCNRFYHRQFITRKNINHDILSKLESLLADYFNSEKVQDIGLPSVKYISDQLNLSPDYLSDMLKTLTGQSTQQHIHDKLIEKAKEILSTTSLSVSEIAYKLGFEYPQSFSKLFKNKTKLSPLEYRHSYT